MWSFIKSVVKTVGKAIAGIVGFLIGALGSIVLFWMRKKVRLHIWILQADQKDLVTVAQVEASVQRADQILKAKFNTKILHYGNPYIEIIKEPPPGDVLDINHTNSNWFGREVKDFIAQHAAGWNGIPISLGFPITVFVVRSIKHGSEDWRGFFTGFVTDSLFITPDGVNDPTTFAHELGHCMLLDRSQQSNLMYHKENRGTSVTGWQKWAFRTSRNVNFW